MKSEIPNSSPNDKVLQKLPFRIVDVSCKYIT